VVSPRHRAVGSPLPRPATAQTMDAAGALVSRLRSGRLGVAGPARDRAALCPPARLGRSRGFPHRHAGARTRSGPHRVKRERASNGTWTARVPGFEPGMEVLQIQRGRAPVVSCWFLVCAAPPLCPVFGLYWTTSGLRLAAERCPRHPGAQPSARPVRGTVVLHRFAVRLADLMGLECHRSSQPIAAQNEEIEVGPNVSRTRWMT
jgi:hypothetical protein